MKYILGLYSGLHFLVDLASMYLVLSFLVPQQTSADGYFYVIVLYNMFAFAFGLPLGILADKMNKNALTSAAGCAFVAAAYLFIACPLLSCVIAGIGNAAFHIGCGIDVLHMGSGKAAYTGIFVATGAGGVWLATRMASGLISGTAILVPLLLASGFALVFVWKHNKTVLQLNNPIPKYLKPAPRMLVLVFCLLLTVCLRSYIGMLLSFEWKADWRLSLFFVLAVIAGKMLGGILGDRLGWLNISVPSLLVSAVLFLFSFHSPTLGILSVLLFNMTMPITLTALANIFPGEKGFAFGLTMAALFIGFLPSAFFNGSIFFTPVFLFAGTLISAAALWAGLLLYDRNKLTYD